jgi:predicted RND superfamily exporter protein
LDFGIISLSNNGAYSASYSSYRIPNCIFLTKNTSKNLVRMEIKRVRYKVITKVGTATLILLTTAAGFATFIITNNSELLKEFGIISSLSIVALYA